jgi:hypothetical protein
MQSLSPDGSKRLRHGVPVVMALTLGVRGSSAVAGGDGEAPVPLSFADLFAVGPATPSLSPAAFELNGRRVRLVGFMAQLERRRRGGFYLCPKPMEVEAGGRLTADLPAEAVRVSLPAAGSRVLPFVSGRVEVVGVLDVGCREDQNGDVSWIRLTAGRSLTSRRA